MVKKLKEKDKELPIRKRGIEHLVRRIQCLVSELDACRSWCDNLSSENVRLVKRLDWLEREEGGEQERREPSNNGKMG